MIPDRSRIPYLLKSWRDNTCTKAEFDECLLYFAQGQTDPVLLEWMEEEWELLSDQSLEQKNFEHLYPALGPAKVRRLNWVRIAVAAAVVLLFSIGYIYMNHRKADLPGNEVSKTKQDVLPGSSKAILTLADGTKIILDSAVNGILVKQGKTNVIKTDSGKLLYSSIHSNEKEEIGMNELRTPRGGIFSVTLPDGTTAWLNAASSITYPTKFTGQKREIKITGEVYFEVAKDAKHPFLVSFDQTRVEVLGTHFNIKAYSDERENKITLLEGAVNITTPANSRRLSPGEQALVEAGAITVNKNADLEKVMAWKNGEMVLTNGDTKQLMREISRWYDVDVKFSGTVPDKKFYGSIDRNVPLSSVLNVLKAYGINTKLENKKLIIQ